MCADKGWVDLPGDIWCLIAVLLDFATISKLCCTCRGISDICVTERKSRLIIVRRACDGTYYDCWGAASDHTVLYVDDTYHVVGYAAGDRTVLYYVDGDLVLDGDKVYNFPYLNTISGSVVLSNKRSLERLYMPNLVSVRSMLFAGCTNLVDFDLRSLRVVHRTLNFSGTGITNADTLCLLSEVGGIVLSNCKNLTNINGLRGLVTITDCILSECPVLGNIDGLCALTTVKGVLDLDNSRSIKTLNGLKKLTTLGDMSVRGCNITDHSGLRAELLYDLLDRGCISVSVRTECLAIRAQTNASWYWY